MNYSECWQDLKKYPGNYHILNIYLFQLNLSFSYKKNTYSIYLFFLHWNTCNLRMCLLLTCILRDFLNCDYVRMVCWAVYQCYGNIPTQRACRKYLILVLKQHLSVSWFHFIIKISVVSDKEFVGNPLSHLFDLHKMLLVKPRRWKINKQTKNNQSNTTTAWDFLIIFHWHLF